MRTRHSNMLAMARSLHTTSEPRLVSQPVRAFCNHGNTDRACSTTDRGNLRQRKKT